MVKNGQRTFNLNVKVPADVVSNVDAEIKTHAKWMRDNHSYDDSKIQLVHYYVSKSDELVNFANPDDGITGNVLFSINEVYVRPEGLVSISMLLGPGLMPPVSSKLWQSTAKCWL